MNDPKKGDKWRFKPDGNPNNKQYWNELADILEVDPANGIKYQWVNKSVRSPTWPKGVTRTLISFLKKFELATETTTAVVKDDEVHALLGSTAAAPAVTTKVVKACSVCTDDEKPLRDDGKCDDCHIIRILIKKFAKPHSLESYYGIDLVPHRDKHAL